MLRRPPRSNSRASSGAPMMMRSWPPNSATSMWSRYPGHLRERCRPSGGLLFPPVVDEFAVPCRHFHVGQRSEYAARMSVVVGQEHGDIDGDGPLQVNADADPVREKLVDG
jgi:hypothetical protein